MTNLIRFYQLRKEASYESVDKYGIDYNVSFYTTLYSCVYDLIWFKVICSKYGYIVYMRNSYYNIGIDGCCTILKEFTTKKMRKQGVSRDLIASMNCSAKLMIGDTYDKESKIIGYIKSIQ